MTGFECENEECGAIFLVEQAIADKPRRSAPECPLCHCMVRRIPESNLLAEIMAVDEWDSFIR